MNREDHLRRALPSWLRLPRVEEIVVVDWPDDRPLTDLPSIAPRLRVVRVEHESRAVSFARMQPKNTGITWSSCVQMRRRLPALTRSHTGSHAGRLPLLRRELAAGDREEEAVSQRTVPRLQCAVRAGERIFRIYPYLGERRRGLLREARVRRIRAPRDPGAFLGIHRAWRCGARVVPVRLGLTASVEETISRSPAFQELFNASIARQQPWGPKHSRAMYVSVAHGDRWEVVRRDKEGDLPRLAEVEAAARLFALRKLVSTWTNVPWAEAELLDSHACFRRIATTR